MKLLNHLTSPRTFAYTLVWLTFLLIIGTLAQAHMGLYLAEKKYFAAWLIEAYGVIPVPGGRLTLTFAFICLVCKLFFKSPLVKKNSGIIVAHLGALLLLAGGYVTAYGAVEGLMLIREGETKGYVEIHNDKELALIRSINNNSNDITAFSGSRLAIGQVLPVADGISLRVDKFHAGNRDNARPALATLTLIGHGPDREIRLMELSDHDKVGGNTRGNATINLGQEIISLELRPRRLQLPIKIEVIDFKKEMHPGTEMARHYGSKVNVVGKSTREALIQMNEPLRDSGYTFYQSHFIEGQGPQPDITILAVVKNAGRMFPYISSIIICIGILIHLLMQLPRLIEQKSRLSNKKPATLLSLLMLPFLMASDTTPKITDDFGAVLIQHQGRIKPLDTLSRFELLAFHGKQTYRRANPKNSNTSEKIQARQWLKELLYNDVNANDRKIFKVLYPAVIRHLGLNIDPDKLYSYNDLIPGIILNEEKIHQVLELDVKQREPVERQIADLYQKILRYRDLEVACSGLWRDIPLSSPTLRETIGVAEEHISCWQLMSNIEKIQGLLEEVKQKPRSEFNEEDKSLDSLVKSVGQRFEFRGAMALAIIPPDPSSASEQWFSPWMLIGQSGNTNFHKACLRNLEDALNGHGSWANFNAQVAKGISSDLRETGQLELFNNKADLFYRSLYFYIGSFLLLIASWVGAPRLLSRLSFVCALVGVTLHGGGIILRMMIMSRPPVSTLYESILFAGFISVLVFVILEWIYRNSLGLLGAGVCGTILHFIGLKYLVDGDSLGMLQAVLDSNFWLATHVVTIVIGYGITFVAGIFGHIYLFQKAFGTKRNLTELSTIMHWMAVMALLFTTLGTILGGIWADQSWGRFWGWDPKENGALLIVLWLLIMVHGRLGGMFTTLGYATGLALGNICVALAWFGVNLLSVGLHSYGFTDSIAFNLIAFCFFEVGLAFGLRGIASYRSVPRTQ